MDDLYSRRIHLGGWVISQSDDGEHLRIERTGKPGNVKLKANDNGVLAELWHQNDDLVMSSFSRPWSDLQPLSRKLPRLQEWM